MFKTAATRIAHNSTIPALAGNSDLRQFQDLINAEKVVLVSCVSLLCIAFESANILVNSRYRFQRLGVDLTKAAESLRAWGVGEGDDLTVSGAFVSAPGVAMWCRCYLVHSSHAKLMGCIACSVTLKHT